MQLLASTILEREVSDLFLKISPEIDIDILAQNLIPGISLLKSYVTFSSHNAQYGRCPCHKKKRWWLFYFQIQLSLFFLHAFFFSIRMLYILFNLNQLNNSWKLFCNNLCPKMQPQPKIISLKSNLFSRMSSWFSLSRSLPHSLFSKQHLL